MIDVEETAVRLDAEQRIEQLRALQAVLEPDADDPYVLSELIVLRSEITAAEQALQDAQ